MELGALVCSPKAPRCLVCPLRKICAAHRLGREEEFPELAARPRAVSERMTAGIVERKGALLLYQRKSSLMSDLWEFPGGTCRSGETPSAALAREALEHYRVRLRPVDEIARLRHSIMNRRITLHALRAELLEPPPEGGLPKIWVEPGKVERLPVSSMVQKILRVLSRG